MSKATDTDGWHWLQRPGKYLAAHEPDKASHPALLEREDCTQVAWYRCLRTSRWRGA
jgi:hypothetical protein